MQWVQLSLLLWRAAASGRDPPPLGGQPWGCRGGRQLGAPHGLQRCQFHSAHRLSLDRAEAGKGNLPDETFISWKLCRGSGYIVLCKEHVMKIPLVSWLMATAQLPCHLCFLELKLSLWASHSLPETPGLRCCPSQATFWMMESGSQLFFLESPHSSWNLCPHNTPRSWERWNSD